VLFLYTTKVVPYLSYIWNILLDYLMEAFKLFDIFKDNFIKVILHNIDLSWKLLDLSLKFRVVVLFDFVNFCGFTHRYLKGFFLLLKIFTLLLKFLTLLLHFVNNFLLCVIEIFVN